MRKPITLVFIASLFMASLFEVTVVAAQPIQKIPVIVGFKDTSDVGLIEKYGGDVKYRYSSISAVACSLAQGAIEALERNPGIAYIELDGKVQMTQEELPPGFFPIPFDGVDRIDAELVHPYNKGAGVKVAILDTGIDYNHDELKNRFEDVKGDDFVEGDGDPMDDNGHGTLCAGIVAAENDGLGVAPEATLYAVKVLDNVGNGDINNVIAGIEWSIENEMNIISMSLRSTKDNQPLHEICDAAYNAGILVVAAAGNDYRIRGRNKELDTVGYPARYNSVIAVGATDNTDTRASYSSTGSTIELAAPGDYINSTLLGNTYAIGSGTSMACPHVTGTAALVFNSPIDETYDLDGDNTWDASEVREKLKNTADDLDTIGWDSWYGYGLVDANADPGAPSITKLTPAVGAFINTATPTISATVIDAEGVNENSIIMNLDGDPNPVSHTYDSPLVSFIPNLEDGLHRVTLTASDITGKLDVTSWPFRVDTVSPAMVTEVTVNPVSSSSLFISWKTIADPGVVTYKVYKMAPGETEHTWMRLYVSSCPQDEQNDYLGFTDTGLEPNAEYSYKISAVDMAGNEGLLPEDGAIGTTIPPQDGGVLHIDGIYMDWWLGTGTNRKHAVVYAEARIRIVDELGVPVSGVTVTGHWKDATTDIDSGITDDTGIAWLKSDSIRNPSGGTRFTFVVDGVTKDGWTYNADANVETSDSIIYP